MQDEGGTVGRSLAKLLGIKLDETPRRTFGNEQTRSESIPLVQTTDSFFERTPTSMDWVREHTPTGERIWKYVLSLFPVLNWISHYNLDWLAGDLISGFTVGAILVPQGMAYAMLAKLQPQYGLYSSFMGVATYWIFGTSKDISIGPVAVLSTVVGNVVDDLTTSLDGDISPFYIASALSLVAGSIVLLIGLLRCGWIVDLISIPSLSAFMTGSAITIAVSQLPALLGVTGFSTRGAPYKIIINTFIHLPDIQLDAALGLSALFVLYFLRHTLTVAAEKYPQKKRMLFFANTMRSVFVILVYTLISFFVNMRRRDDPAFRILGNVPSGEFVAKQQRLPERLTDSGFGHIGVPYIDQAMVSKFSSYLPATVIVMLVEHIAIAKSFGRINNYQIDPSQEMVAIGIANILNPLIGGYPTTGSFSRTAVQSKAGVRTPAAGIVVAAVVLLASYLLTGIFFFIPSASLSAVIMHAVGDLVTPPNTIYQFWKVSPLEVLIFFVGVLVSIFDSIEDGLYATVCISAAILFYRILKARGHFLGKVRVHSVIGDHVIADNHKQVVGDYGTLGTTADNNLVPRNLWLPFSREDGSNPEVDIENIYPGVFIYRLTEGLNYPNAAHSLDYLTYFIYSHTRRTTTETFEAKGDRPWNAPGPSRSPKARAGPEAHLPTLKAIILDFSSVNHIDVTSVQRLIDVRTQLDKYAAPAIVDWHFACINTRWTKRGLISGGFGLPTPSSDGLFRRGRSIFSVAEIGGKNSAAAAAEDEANVALISRISRDEEEAMDYESRYSQASTDDQPRASIESVEKTDKSRRRGAAVDHLDPPLFHVDLTSAAQSAIALLDARFELSRAGSLVMETVSSEF